MTRLESGSARCVLAGSVGRSAIRLFAVATIAGLFASTSAFAQTAGAQNAGGATAETTEPAPVAQADAPAGIADIVVTARRVAENIQKVPIAVTAFSAARLQQIDVRDATALAKITPGVTLCCTAWNNGTLTVVRGIQQGAPTYFGDVPVRAEGYANFFDVSNVQVLKGPQGTLFGQASVAGAFIFQPRRPGEKFGGYVSGAIGSYDRRTIEGALDIPLLSDRILLRLSGVSNSRRGYIHDLSTNQYYGNEDYYIVRPQLTVKLTDNLENNTLLQYSHATTTGQSNGLWVIEDLNSVPSQFSQSAALTALNGGSVAAFNALKDQLLSTQLALGPYKVLGLSTGCANRNGTPTPGPAQATSLRYQGTACPGDTFIDKLLINTTTWSFAEDWSVKNIFGTSRTKVFVSPLDLDSSPLILQNSGSFRNNYFITGSPGAPVPHSYSDELQVQGKVGIVDLTIGTFHIWRNTNTGIVFATPLTTTSASDIRLKSEAHAIYAQANVHLDSVIEGLTATVGARYNQDKIRQTVFGINPTTLAVTSTIGGPDSPAGHVKFHNVPYTLGLQYQATPGVMLFVTNAQSYNAGGLQNVSGFPTFSPAKLNNVEAGFKSTFDIGSVKARFNASAFNGQFTNVQVTTFTLITNPANGVVSAGNVTRNAAEARVRGAESEFTVLPFQGLEVSGAVGYLDNRYTKYPSLDPLTLQPIDLSSTRFTRAPKWKTDLRGTYTLPLPSEIGKISFTADWAFQSLTIHQNIPAVPTNPADPQSGLRCSRLRTAANGYGPLSADGGKAYLDCKPPYSNVDLTLEWRDVMGHDGLSLLLSVTNLTKNIWTGSQANLDRSFGFTGFQPAVPRMWSLRARYDF